MSGKRGLAEFGGPILREQDFTHFVLFIEELSDKYTLVETVPLLLMEWSVVVFFLVLRGGKAFDIWQADDAFDSLFQECGGSFCAAGE